MVANGLAWTAARGNPRLPAILLFVFVALGILVDRYVDVSWPVWSVLGGLSLTVWVTSFFFSATGRAALAICVFAGSLGGFWHHIWWNIYPANNLSCFASELPEPVRIRAVVCREPRWIVAPVADAFETTPAGIRTRVGLHAESIQVGSSWETVSDSLPMYVDGQLSGFAVGDRIEAIGLLVVRNPTHNPGEFDQRQFARSERELCSMSIIQPEAITLVERPSSFIWTKSLSNLRQRFDQLIWRSLDPTNAALASGILLGIREQLDEAEKTNYLMTGTIHLLAISGLHVGILAGGVLSLGTLGLVRRRTCLWLTIGFVAFYACLVEFQPTVARAAVLIAVWCFAKISGRAGFSFNSLAVAALIVLATNPCQLFQVGAQLSYLAVATMSATHRFYRVPRRTDPLDELVWRTRPWPVQAATAVFGYLLQAVCVSGFIWLVALPLVAYRFHIVAPVALIANPLLMIPIAVSLLSGFLFLLVGWWLPLIGGIVGTVFESGLTAIRLIVNTSSEIPCAYWWTAGPSLSFVIVFYLFAFFVFVFPRTRMPARWAISLSIFALAVGWFVPDTFELARQRSRKGLDVIFADVGHGGCALVKLPGGQNLLYDSGSTSSPSFTARTISSLLWKEKIFHLDGIVISHADLDHYSAVDRLTDIFSVGAVYVPEAMTAQTDNPAGELLRRLKLKGVSVRLAYAGQSMYAGQDCSLQILHPRAGVTYSSDNAGSVICDLKYSDQGILFTGDLEAEGLDAVLSMPSRARTSVLAPHHGSVNSDPQRFVPWSAAQSVIVSNDGSSAEEMDLSVFGHFGAQVFVTGRDGAIRVRLNTEAEEAEIRAWCADPW